MVTNRHVFYCLSPNNCRGNILADCSYSWPTKWIVRIDDWIDGAQTSIKVQLYQMQEPQLVKALTEALERGVDVEVMLDPDVIIVIFGRKMIYNTRMIMQDC